MNPFEVKPVQANGERSENEPGNPSDTRACVINLGVEDSLKLRARLEGRPRELERLQNILLSKRNK